MPRIGHSFNAEIRHYARIDWLFNELGTTGFNPVVGRVFLAPFQARYTMTVDRVGFTTGVVIAGNCIVGIYADMGDTPDGGAVIVQSASVAVPAGGAETKEITVADTPLTPGLYWLASEFDDATIGVISISPRPAVGGTLQVRNYARAGGYGALTDPCPTPTIIYNEVPWMFVRVKSVP